MIRLVVIPALVGVAGFATPVAGQQQLQDGRTYRAGTRVVSTPTGVSFAVGEGFQGAYDNKVHAFVMGAFPRPQYLLGVFAYSQGEVDEVADAVAGHLHDVGIEVSPQPGGTATARRASGWFDAMTPGGAQLLYGVVTRGTAGNTVAIIALGPASQREQLEPAAEGVMQSVRFAEPGAAEWNRGAGGHVYLRATSGSDYSPGATSGSGASGATAQLDLCSDGTYGYEYHSETYVSIEGASASSESSDQHTGRWELVADIVGDATLVLDATDGRQFSWPVAEAQEGVMIDGTSYSVSRSQRCR